MPRIVRTTAADPAFIALTRELDADLRVRYGAVQDAYAVYNVFTSETAVVAYVGDSAVGCGCFKPFDASAVELKRMWVDPAHRGGGIGRAIVAALEAWARELGYRAMVLETGTKQTEAIAMYGRCGYVQIPLYGPYVGMEYSVCMRKPLDGAANDRQ